MPQGFSLTPGIFNTVLKDLLKQSPHLPPETVLIQYVDDLLIASTTRASCSEATINLLKYLGECGFLIKKSLIKSKVQLVRPRVTFLGNLVSGRGSEMTATQRQAILHNKTPQTVRHDGLFGTNQLLQAFPTGLCWPHSSPL